MVDRLTARLQRLREHLRWNPGDLSAYDELARICDRIQGMEELGRWARREALFRTEGAASAEQAVALLRERVRAGDGDPLSRVRLGELLHYAGEDRDARWEARAGTVWTAFDADHFRLHVLPDSIAERDAPRLLREREQELHETAELFGLELPGRFHVDYFLYDSRLHKQLMTGNDRPAHVHVSEREVHAVHGRDHHLHGPHEDAALLLAQLGRAPHLLEEGAALLAQDRVAGRTPPRAAARLSPMELLDDERFEGADPDQSGWVAYSFTSYLVDRFGMPSFRELYARAARGGRRALEEGCCERISSLQSRWRSWEAMRGQG